VHCVGIAPSQRPSALHGIGRSHTLQASGSVSVCRLWATSAALRISHIADFMQLLYRPRRPAYQPKGAPAPDDRWRHIAHRSRLANRDDLPPLHHTNASGPSVSVSSRLQPRRSI
jgi:hypothetical protein